MHIALLGHYGIGNIGNDATLKSAMMDFKKAVPDCTISVISSNPTITSYDFQVPVFPLTSRFGRKLIICEKLLDDNSKLLTKHSQSLTRNFAKSIKPLVRMVRSARYVVKMSRAIYKESPHIVNTFRYLATVDALVICGTGQLQDRSGGPWVHPYSRFKWAFLSRLRGKKVIILSVGAVPAKTKVGKFFLSRILKHADYISCRDEYSQSACRVNKQRFQPLVYPDIVFNHPAEKNSTNCCLEKQKIIGINTMPLYLEKMVKQSLQEKYNNYIVILAETIVRLHRNNWKIGLFNADTDDIEVMHDLKKVISERYSPELSKTIYSYPCKNIAELIPVIHNFDVVVAARFHGILISTLCEKPTIGIADEEKQRDFFKAEGLEMLGIAFDDFTSEKLLTKINYAYENSAEIKNSIKTLLAKNRSLLDQQYKELTKYLRGACHPEE